MNYLDAIRFRFRMDKYPSHVVLFVTARCNARCNHCFYWKEIQEAKRETELTLDEIEKISKNFRHIKLLSVTGGEPSLRDDLPDIIHIFHKNNGVTNVVFHTNAFFPKKVKELVIRILKENPKIELNLQVSIDGPKELHDEIRKVKNGFKKVEETIRLITEEKKNFKNLNITINTCLTYFNQNRIKELIDYCFENFDIDGYYVSIVRGNAMDPKAKETDIKKYQEVLAHLHSKEIVKSYYNNYPLSSFRRTIDYLAPEVVIKTIEKKTQINPCTGGRSVIVISEEGVVSPCEMLGKKFGNLRENDYDIKKILFTNESKDIKQFIKNKGCACTWECAIMNSIIFNWRAYPSLLKKWLKLEAIKHF